MNALNFTYNYRRNTTENLFFSSTATYGKTDRFFWNTHEKRDARVKKCINLYTFGMQMPGRNFNSPDYRFGYNGVEKTDEISGSANHYEYKFREYDPRIGKFWSVDPLAASYPWNSTYAFAENRVIDGADLEGLEWERKTNTETGNIEGATYKGYGRDGNPMPGTVPTVAIPIDKGGMKLYSSNAGNQTATVTNIYSNASGNVQLPTPEQAGNVYEVYNRTGNDQWGSAKGISALVNAAVDYNQLYPGETVAYGDLKSPTGGGVQYSAGTHHTGTSFQADVRLLSTLGGSRQGNYDEISFDPQRTMQFGNIMNKHGFNEMVLSKGPTTMLRHNLGEMYGVWNFNQNSQGWGKFTPSDMSKFKIGLKIDPGTVHNNHYHFQGFR